METVRILLASTLIAGATGSIVFTQAEETIAPPATGVRDFDFLIGEWHVHHHRLKPGSHEWVDFEGTASNRKLMDGGANMEEHVLDAPYGPYRAIACARTIRIQTNGRSGGSTDAIRTRWACRP